MDKGTGIGFRGTPHDVQSAEGEKEAAYATVFLQSKKEI